MSGSISRRQLLRGLVTTTGLASLCRILGIPFDRGVAQGPDEHVHLPLVAKTGAGDPTARPTETPSATPTSTPSATPTSTPSATPTSTPSATPTSTPTATLPAGARVVHVHNEAATFWSGQTDYWNYVDQETVNRMVDRGVMALTGASSVPDAWHVLLPYYQIGQGIAIKVNFNNAWSCDDDDGMIDGLVQPVNAIVRGLKQIGVDEADIWVYEAIRRIPDRFVADNQYSGVRFFDRECRESATYESDDPDALIMFSPPEGTAMPDVRVTDVLIDATYLINMPIMKRHSVAGVTLGFKNHLGSVNNPGAYHDCINPHGGDLSEVWNPMVDTYLNPHIGSKTILVVGDALFAALQFNQAPVTWSTFGDEVPNSLFFATDPVAIDCVMCDYLNAEWAMHKDSDVYLAIAENEGLGTYERSDPWGDGYDLIDYVRI